MDDVKRARMSFSGCDHADATQVVTTGDHDQIARVELYVVLDLSGLEVESNRVVDFDVRIRVTDRTAVVGDDHGHTFGRHKHFSYFTQLVLKIHI